MENQLLKKLLDNRNKEIWNAVKQEYNIVLKEARGNHYHYDLKFHTASIYIPYSNLSKELFTHELLHLYLRSENIFLSEWLIKCFKMQALLHWSFDENLFEQIGHQLEHAKIFVLYQKLGFDPFLFSDTFFQPVCNQMHIDIIRSGLRKAAPSHASVDLFINSFYAMKCHLNEEISYESHFEILEVVSPGLYIILENFWAKWESYDIETNDNPDYSYKTIAIHFIEQLGEWSIRTLHAKNKMKRSPGFAA